MADRQHYLDKVRAIVVDQFGVSYASVTEHTKLIEDLGSDSLDSIELIMEVEDAFHVSVDDERAREIKTVGDIATWLEEVHA